MRTRTEQGGATRGRGVSHVIGVVMLVAIVVLLVSVVAVFATGFGGDLENPAPTFASTTSFNDSWNGNGHYLNITHEGGGTIHTDEVYLSVTGAQRVDGPPGGPRADAGPVDDVISGQVGDEFTATETIVINRSSFRDAAGPLSGSKQVDLTDAVVRIVYKPGVDERSYTIYECRPAVPDCEQNPA